MTHIQKLQDFTKLVEDNIENEINIDNIINDLYISKFHFYRLFKAVIGISVNEYIKRIRVYYSAIRIINSRESLLSTAVKYGFSSHELLSRNFKKYVGLTPKQWRNNYDLKKLDDLKPYNIESLLLSLKNSNGQISVKDDVVNISEKCLVGIETLTTEDKPLEILRRINYFLKSVHRIDDIAEEILYRVTHSIDTKSDPIQYREFIGVPVADLNNIPKGFESYLLKGGHYLKMEHKGKIYDNSGSIIDTYDFIYRYKISSSEYKLNMDCNFEVYDEKFISPDSDDSVTDIYLGLM